MFGGCPLNGLSSCTVITVSLGAFLAFFSHWASRIPLGTSGNFGLYSVNFGDACSDRQLSKVPKNKAIYIFPSPIGSTSCAPYIKMGRNCFAAATAARSCAIVGSNGTSPWHLTVDFQKKEDDNVYLGQQEGDFAP